MNVFSLSSCQNYPRLEAYSQATHSPKSSLIRFQEFVLRKGVQATKVLYHVMAGIVHREKVGPEIICELKELFFDKTREMLEKFRSYDITPKPPADPNPLNVDQIAKLKEFIIAEKDQKKREACVAFLKRATHEHATRLDFTDSDWKILSQISLALASEHLENLNQLFNTSILDHHQEKMGEQFGINYKEAVVAEVLAKTVAYASNLGGETIQIPIEREGTYSLVTYSIREARVGDDLPCYILESEDREVEPWFVARGTNLQGFGKRATSIESILADVIDENGLAEDIIIKAMFSESPIKENGKSVRHISLLGLFENWKREGKRPILCGHSLGGYLITDITVRLHELVGKAYAFSATGISHHLEAQWNLIMEKNPQQRGKIVTFASEGDAVPSAGRKLIDLHIAIKPSSHFHLEETPIHNHMRMLLNRDFNAQEVDIVRENAKISRRITESARANFGFLVRGLMFFFNKESLPDWWVSRHVYRQALLEYNNRIVKS